MVWYKELGFSKNPFSIKPGAFSSDIVGYDLSEILKKIDDGKVLFIEGEYGFGKTSILKHIISQFGGQRKVAYYNCNRAEETINVKSILKGSKGAIARIFGAMPSELILLLDEVERISQSDQKELLKYHQEGNLKSIVFFGPDFDKISFSIEFRKLMINNVIKLTELTDNEAVQLVRERIGDLKHLDDRIIKLVFRHSSNNPRLLLENLEDVVRYAVDNNEEQVTEEHLKEVLGIDVKPQRAQKEEPSKKAEQAEKPKQAEAKPKPQPKPKKQKPKKPKAQKKAKPKPQPKPKETKPKPKSEKPKQAEEKPKKEKAHSRKDTSDDEFEDKKPKKKSSGAAIDFEEEADYSEPAEEEPGEDDKGGEYYYYY